MNHLYLILNIKTHLFWSNETGWVDRESADHFTESERLRLNLPVDGKWVTPSLAETIDNNV